LVFDGDDVDAVVRTVVETLLVLESLCSFHPLVEVVGVAVVEIVESVEFAVIVEHTLPVAAGLEIGAWLET